MIKHSYAHRKPIRYPRPSAELAEFIGIFLGDGSFSNRYQITVSFNHHSEHGHASHVERLIKKLFGIQCAYRIRKKYGSADLVVTGSNLVDHLRILTGIVSGNARKNTRLPDWIFATKRCAAGFARGFFDAEGCVYQHSYISNGKRYRYVKIAVTNYTDELRSLFTKALKLLGVKSVSYGTRVHLYNTNEVTKFLKLVGTNNPKNIDRLRSFK